MDADAAADTDADVDADAAADTDADVDADAAADTDADVDADAAADTDADAGPTPVKPTKRTLPVTGFEGLWLAPIGALLLVAGVALVVARRNRAEH